MTKFTELSHFEQASGIGLDSNLSTAVTFGGTYECINTYAHKSNVFLTFKILEFLNSSTFFYVNIFPHISPRGNY